MGRDDVRDSVRESASQGFRGVDGRPDGEVRLDPRGATVVLVVGVGLLLLTGLLASLLQHGVSDFPGRDTFVLLFDLNREQSIPNWYTSGLLLVAAALLGTIAAASRRAGRRDVAHWTVLAVIFVYLSADEAAVIHNYLGNYSGGEPGEVGSGIASVSWVWPAIVLVAMFVLAFIPFLRRLPRRTATLFVIAGAVYVGGALGLEILGAALDTEFAPDTIAGSLMLALEEATEMIGVVIFIYALLTFIAEHSPDARISVAPARSPREGRL